LVSENQFVSLSVWDLLRLTSCVFWSEIFTRRSSLCLLSFGWDLSPKSSHKIDNIVFNNHYEGRKEGSFVCEIGWFFSCANTQPFDKFVAFFPKFSGDSYVEFQEKNISGEFYWNFVQTKVILYQNLWNYALLSAIFILGPYCAEKVQTSTLVCCLHPGKAARPQKNHKKAIWGWKSRTFCFWKTSFVHSRSGTYYALLLGCFGLKFLPDFRHCINWVLAEIWGPDWSQEIGNKFFIDHCRAERKVRLCVKLFDSFCGRHLFDLKFVAFCPKFSGDCYVEFSGKNYFGRIFRKFCANQGYPLQKLVKFRPTFCNYYSGSLFRWKVSHKYFHMLSAPM